MISEAPGTINFTMFLTLMGEKLSGWQCVGVSHSLITGTDPESEITQAFESFDEGKAGLCDAEELREYLTSMGDRFTDEEVDVMFKGAPVDASGNFNYREFIRVLKHGE